MEKHNQIIKLSKSAYQEFEQKLPPLYRIAEKTNEEGPWPLVLFSPYGDKLHIIYDTEET